MKVIEQIISKQLLSAKYHHRTILILVPKNVFPEFVSIFQNNDLCEDGKLDIFFDDRSYVKLRSLTITGEGMEHVDTVVLVNPEDGCQKAVKESKMMPSPREGQEPTWETVRFDK